MTGAETSRGVRALAAGLGLFVLSACAGTIPAPDCCEAPAPTETIQILALNDFHGNLEVPTGETTWFAEGERGQDQLGGAARLGATLAGLREGKDNTITVAAGDLIGASPLASAYFLDEPTIMALNRMELSLAAVGNHEFDRGAAELKRMQQGGCAVHTTREPCALDRPFEGARFTFLAANVLDDEGKTLFPATAVRRFGGVTLGFIGMTLTETATLVSPAGTAGYRFADEAETANALVSQLRAEGADAAVLLIHQGGWVDPAFNASACPGLSGDIIPILDRLDPFISLVVSGHTHHAYVCEMPNSDGSARLLTSAGRYGAFVTDIRMRVDAAGDRVVALSAENVPVLERAGEQPDVQSLVHRYASATAQIAQRTVGRIEGSLAPQEGAMDTPLANLIADAQLSATRDPARGNAQLALMNTGGVRTRVVPGADGSVTYGQIFALQPFGNTLVVLEMTGSELKQVLEQQFTDETPATVRQSLLVPSAGFKFSFDRTRPRGDRIVEMRLNGYAIELQRSYRVTTNNFVASGGDGFGIFAQARVIADGGLDLDALEAYLAPGVVAPDTGRVREVSD